MNTFIWVLIIIVGVIVVLIIAGMFFQSNYSDEQNKKVTELNANMAKLENDKQTTEKKISELNNQQNSLRDDVTKREQKIELLEKKILELNKEIEELLAKQERRGSSKLDIHESNNTNSMIDKSNKENNELLQLKKQLSDLEDDLSDAEDDRDDYQKKWEKVKGELREAQESLDEYERKTKELEERLTDKTNKLETATKDINKKDRSLFFLNEILQAKDVDSIDIKDQNEKINNIVNTAMDDLIRCLENVGHLDQKEEPEYERKLWQWANLQRKTWLQANKVIAFIGEFSAGKTSIVNRILSQDDINAPQLPVSSKATTAIPTYISYNEKEFIPLFTTPEGKLKFLAKSTFEKVNKSVLEEVSVTSLLQYFVMSYNNKNLKNLSILDTPGFNSNDKDDAKRTAEVIREADALFWVFDANAGEINKSSLSIIQQNLHDLPLYIVINKVDTKSAHEIDELEVHIKETIKKENLSVQGYVRFSSKEPINELMEVIKGVPHDNSKNDFLYSMYKKSLEAKQQIEQIFKNDKKTLNSYNDSTQQCLENLVEQCERISMDCNELKELPQLNEHFFSKDNYEMSLDEHNKYTETLAAIQERSKIIPELNEKLKNCSKNTQCAEVDLAKARDARNDIERSLANFKKVLVKWDPNFTKNYNIFSSLFSQQKPLEMQMLNSDLSGGDVVEMAKQNPQRNSNNQIRKKAIDIVAKKLDIDKSKILDSAKFFNDLGADSLDAIELTMEFEKEFNISIPDTVVENIRTFGEVMIYLNKVIK